MDERNWNGRNERAHEMEHAQTETKSKRTTRVSRGTEGERERESGEKRTIKDHRNEGKEERGGESGGAQIETDRTGITRTITWLFLVAKVRPFIFRAPAVAVCPEFPCTRGIHPFIWL